MIAARSTTGGGTISPFHSHIEDDVGYDGVFVAAPPRRTIYGAGPRSGRHGVEAQKKGLPGPPPAQLGPARADSRPAPENVLQGVLGSFRFVSVLKRENTLLFFMRNR